MQSEIICQIICWRKEIFEKLKADSKIVTSLHIQAQAETNPAIKIIGRYLLDISIMIEMMK